MYTEKYGINPTGVRVDTLHNTDITRSEAANSLSIEAIFLSPFGDFLLSSARFFSNDCSFGTLMADAMDAFCSADSANLAAVIAEEHREHGWTVVGLFRQDRPHILMHAAAMDPDGLVYDFIGVRPIGALSTPFGSTEPLMLRKMAPARVDADRADLLRRIATGLPWVPASSRPSLIEMVEALRRYLVFRLA